MKNPKNPKTSQSSEPPNPAERGKAALAKLMPRLLALPAGQLTAINVDVAEAGLVAAGVGARITAEPLYARFRAIAGPEFDLANVQDLADVAWAARYAALEAARLSSSSNPKVPAALIQEANSVERRMQRCCEYHFQDDPVLGPILDELRPGTGYRDIAGDLKGYAGIYEQKRAELEHDRVNYHATDAADAIRLAEQILEHLAASLTAEGRAAADLAVRAWTLLRQVYAEAQAGGLFIERHDPTAPARYPSLFTATRAQAARPKASELGSGADTPPANAGGEKTPPTPPDPPPKTKG
jgi:hypothetical protein